MSSTASLEHTTMYHSNRKTMREKWRKIGSPQTHQQKNFVHHLCKTINFYRAYKVGRTAGFSNFSAFPVNIEGFGKFPTSEAALQAYKDPHNVEYIRQQMTARSPLISKNLGSQINIRDDWEMVREETMYRILHKKFSQHIYLRHVLLATGLSPIVHSTRADNVWGDGGGKGLNLLGKLLVRLRSEYQRSNI